MLDRHRLGVEPTLKALLEQLTQIEVQRSRELQHGGRKVTNQHGAQSWRAAPVAKAAEAERIIEELRQMGNEVLQSWGHRQPEKKGNNAKPGMNRKEKTSTGTRGSSPWRTSPNSYCHMARWKRERRYNSC